MADRDKQANRRAGMTITKEQTSLRAIAACMQSKEEGWVNAGMLVEQKKQPSRMQGKTNSILKVVKTEFKINNMITVRLAT